MTIHVDDKKREERREEWRKRVNRLIDEVERWAQEEGWPVQRSQKHVREQLLGEYDVPELRMRVPGGDMFLTPIASHVVGADGRVDLEAWPTLNRVKLIGHDGGWQVMTDSNVPLRQAWNRETFRQLVHDLQA